MDYESINTDLFSLDIPCCIDLNRNAQLWNQNDHQIL